MSAAVVVGRSSWSSWQLVAETRMVVKFLCSCWTHKAPKEERCRAIAPSKKKYHNANNRIATTYACSTPRCGVALGVAAERRRTGDWTYWRQCMSLARHEKLVNNKLQHESATKTTTSDH
ncbi:unnamed protein product [Ceratitis capitata]|uniref:(Mediterranean fruit fly) hypothetical protein n=1 Tax=Ceratitis capitata TaxID=7213 RepID=A0A811VM79_CERCA|nr:unnamed protein product [Ceratitis capitata]